MKKEIEKNAKEEILLSFLKKTKDGKYAVIDQGSLNYARIKERRETIESYSDIYYYNLS